MNEFIKKLIERLEKGASVYPSGYGCMSYGVKAVPISEAKEIVNQLAEEYKSRMIINGQYCFQTCACAEKCNQCSRLNGNDTDIDWYEDIEDWTEEYNNDFCEWKKTDKSKYSIYHHALKHGNITLEFQDDFKFCPYCGRKIKIIPYQPKGE